MIHKVGRYHSYAVVLGHFLIGGIEVGFIAAGTAHTCTRVVRNEELADTLHKFDGADMGSNPIFQSLTGRGFGVGVVAGTQRGHKEGGPERTSERGQTLQRRSGLQEIDLPLSDIAW
jgi:hypothetical protein